MRIFFDVWTWTRHTDVLCSVSPINSICGKYAHERRTNTLIVILHVAATHTHTSTLAHTYYLFYEVPFPHIHNIFTHQTSPSAIRYKSLCAHVYLDRLFSSMSDSIFSLCPVFVSLFINLIFFIIIFFCDRLFSFQACMWDMILYTYVSVSIQFVRFVQRFHRLCVGNIFFLWL